LVNCSLERLEGGILSTSIKGVKGRLGYLWCYFLFLCCPGWLLYSGWI